MEPQFTFKNRSLFYRISLIFIVLSVIEAFFFFAVNVYFLTPYWLITACFYFLSLPVFLLFKLSGAGKKSRRNVSAFLTSLFVSVLLCEIILRISGMMLTPLEKLPWGKHKYLSIFDAPNTALQVYGANEEHHFNSPEFNYLFKTNRDGLSDIQQPIEKPAGEFRIAGLGDSFTEGIGTHQDSTWLKFLEAGLKQKYNRQMAFFNGGIGGSDPFYEYIILDRLILKYKPDLLLLAINCSDVGDVTLRGGFERFQKDGTVKFRKGPSWEWMYQYLHMVRFVVNKVLHYDSYFTPPSRQVADEQKAIDQICNCLISFKDMARQKNFKLLVIYHPWLWEWEIEKSKYPPIFGDFCKKNGIQFLNLMDYYINVEKIKGAHAHEYFWKQDCHNNVRGYEAFARGVMWKLENSPELQ